MGPTLGFGSSGRKAGLIGTNLALAADVAEELTLRLPEPGLADGREEEEDKEGDERLGVW